MHSIFKGKGGMRLYQSYSLFKRNLHTVFSISIISMLIVLIALCLYITHASVKEMQEQTLQVTTILSANTQKRMEELQLASDALIHNEVIQSKLMFNADVDYISWVDGHQEMWQIQRSYPDALFLACYNPLRNELFCTVDLAEESSGQLLNWMQKHSAQEDGQLELFDIQLANEYPTEERLPTIVFSQLADQAHGGKAGAVLVGIDCEFFQALLTMAARQMQDTMLLIDEDDRVISHTEVGEIRQDYSQEPFVQRIREMSQDSGIFSERLNDQPYTIAYHRNQDGYAVVSAVASHTLLGRLFAHGWVLPVVFGAIVLIAVLFSVIGAQIMFFPIKKIVSPYVGQLDQPGADLSVLISQMEVYRENLDMQITGTAKRWIWQQLSPEEMMEVPVLLASMNAPLYLAALLRVDRSVDFLCLKDDEQNKVTSALRNECMDALDAAGYHGVYIPIKFYRFDVIIPISSEEEREMVAQTLKKGLDSFYEKLNQPCCASLSQPVDQIDLVPKATSESLHLLIDRFYEAGSLPKVYVEQKCHKEQLRYDYVWENDIWNAIKNNREDLLLAALDRFMEKIYCCRYEYARFFTEQMLLNVTANWMKLKPDAILLPYYDEIQRIILQDTLDLIHQSLKKYLCSLLILDQACQPNDRNYSIVQSTKRITNQHFRDPSFSASMVAEMLGISTIYFNRVFKQGTGLSFGAYLNSCRLDMVARLLCSTQEPLSRIYQVAGISNENYCYVLFKKHYGMTPNQYRQHYTDSEELPTAQIPAEEQEDTGES